MIEALKMDFDVTLITGGPVDLARLNAYYGTSLSPEDFQILQAPMPFGLGRTAQFAALRGAFFQRYLRRVGPRYDAMISAYNVCDFGAPGIQFIADFSFMDEWRNKLHPALATQKRWWYGDSILRRAYLGLCGLISPVDREAWKRNVTVANSDWSVELMRREFGIESRVLYSPGAIEFSPVSWENRENGFVCVGRVVPEKRMDAVIRILDAVREAGHDVHLHILGGLEDSPFGAKLRELAAPRKWVSLEGRTFGRKKGDLIAGHRFGINGCETDNMPNAVAEMVKAGCIAFVPNGGGQTEIVNHPMLSFEDEADAAQKICTVLSSRTLQDKLRQHLGEQAAKFSVENFQAGFRNVVFEVLSKKLVSSRTSVLH